MPKINVYPPCAAEVGPNNRIEVGYSVNRYVQVATTQPTLVLAADGSPSRPVEGPANPADLKTGEAFHWDGQHVDLDRNGINNLIRALREARDAAYGKDQ